MSVITSARAWVRAPRRGSTSALDRVSAMAAVVLLAAAVLPGIVATDGPDGEAGAGYTQRPAAAAGEGAVPGSAPAESLVGVYFGQHWSHPSDIRFRRAGGAARDFTVEDVAWQGQSFKHPLYYGARVVHWPHGGEGGGRFGGMVDFVHAKAIADMAQQVRLKGRLDGKPVPEQARVGELFDKLEFSHGHNMLFLAGLMRLQSLAPKVSPYVGLGVGISLPHTEIHIARNDPRRTYEYQYTGPAAQALAGVEIRLPRISLFLEYKFTIAGYSAPLTGREGSWLPVDLGRQWLSWWRGDAPPGGHASTLLATHHLLGGLGVRLGPVAQSR